MTCLHQREIVARTRAISVRDSRRTALLNHSGFSCRTASESQQSLQAHDNQRDDQTTAERFHSHGERRLPLSIAARRRSPAIVGIVVVAQGLLVVRVVTAVILGIRTTLAWPSVTPHAGPSEILWGVAATGDSMLKASDTSAHARPRQQPSSNSIGWRFLDREGVAINASAFRQNDNRPHVAANQANRLDTRKQHFSVRSLFRRHASPHPLVALGASQEIFPGPKLRKRRRREFIGHGVRHGGQ